MPKKRMKGSRAADRRLDQFLKTLEIEQDTREKIVGFGEKVTFMQLKKLSTGRDEEEEKKKGIKLRLKRG